jgi:four helix bundle protein
MAGVRRFEDLIAWQLAMELAAMIHQISETGPSTRDAEFRGQLRASAKKAPALIADGFLRFTRLEFVRYLRMARAEIGEVQNHLEFARRRRLFSASQLDQATVLAKRAMVATSRLLKSKLVPPT